MMGWIKYEHRVAVKVMFCFFFNDTATTEIYTLSLHDALPISQTKSLTHYTKGMLSLHKGALTACRHSVSDTISFPLSGCFSPFPHGTCSLSVIKEYLGLGSGLPIFRQDFTCPALLKNKNIFYLYGTITYFGLPFQKVLVIIFLLLA